MREFLSRLLTAGTIGLIAACVGGPKSPPAALGNVQIAAISYGVGQLKTGAGALHLSVWEPEEKPRAVILALHGFGDYGASTFDRPARHWAEQGYLTYAYDQRGFGNNSSRGMWPGATQLVDDFTSILDAIRQRHRDVPLFVIGHSMGGAVALGGLQGRDDIDGMILAAPAVWGGARLALPYRAAAWGGALVAPDKRWTGQGVVTIQASDNIDVLRALARDPVYLHNPSSREFMGLIRLMDTAVKAAPQIAIPTLVLYGAKDEVAPEQAVRAAYDAVPAQKQLIYYDSGWHLLFRDLQALQVWKDTSAWMDERAPR